MAEPQQYGQFQREAQAAANIRSDYVVPIYSTGQTIDRRPYLVMPLIRGKTLRDLLQAGSVPAKVLARIIREVAEARTPSTEPGCSTAISSPRTS